MKEALLSRDLKAEEINLMHSLKSILKLTKNLLSLRVIKTAQLNLFKRNYSIDVQHQEETENRWTNTSLLELQPTSLNQLDRVSSKSTCRKRNQLKLSIMRKTLVNHSRRFPWSAIAAMYLRCLKIIRSARRSNDKDNQMISVSLLFNLNPWWCTVAYNQTHMELKKSRMTTVTIEPSHKTK